PRWGRVNENFSEDPFLVQTFAVQTIRAMQGDDPNYLKTIACAKHYACNDTDTDRDYADAAPDRRSFWEYYTRGFEASVTQAQVFSVMSAYNSLWGIPCPASHFLLTEVLRHRWGFKGYVVSDCDAIANIYRTHHYVETAPEAAALAVKAGSDLNCGNTLTQFLGKSVEQKLVSEEAIRTALTRILAGRFLLGEFDPPSSVPWTSLSADIIEGQDHRELAREAARQSLVLLKNEGTLLPLDKNKLKKIAVIGPMADSCHLGGYSGRATILVSPRAGIANAFGEAIYSDTVPAGDYISTSNFRGPVVAFSDDGSQMLSSIRNNTWAQYGPLNLDNKTSIELRVASSADGDVSIYLDSLSEKPVATVHIPATGGMDTWKTVSAPLSGLTGSHVVFLRFVGSAVRTEFINLESFSLLPVAPASHANHRVTYAPGSTITGPRNEALLQAAVKAAKEAETVILFVGDNRLLSDEGVDRYELDLPDVQQELVKVIVAANPRTVVVVNTGC
ncbi:MAG TPA: glycoside hydrolase family 3 N-terminal domain-containing protein, partial [Acetobacteraceae bacterium]|nr:glycoside hydrolase family 3 N-terminal domain-containing protein [Acetobacteraceae bacterium]